jgi:hypothetical protein
MPSIQSPKLASDELVQAERLYTVLKTVLLRHYKGMPIHLSAGSACEPAIRAAAKSLRQEGWKVSRYRDGAEPMLRFSRAK